MYAYESTDGTGITVSATLSIAGCVGGCSASDGTAWIAQKSNMGTLVATDLVLYFSTDLSEDEALRYTPAMPVDASQLTAFAQDGALNLWALCGSVGYLRCFDPVRGVNTNLPHDVGLTMADRIFPFAGGEGCFVHVKGRVALPVGSNAIQTEGLYFFVPGMGRALTQLLSPSDDDFGAERSLVSDAERSGVWVMTRVLGTNQCNLVHYSHTRKTCGPVSISFGRDTFLFHGLVGNDGKDGLFVRCDNRIFHLSLRDKSMTLWCQCAENSQFQSDGTGGLWLCGTATSRNVGATLAHATGPGQMVETSIGHISHIRLL